MFVTTHWSVVLAARDTGSSESDAAIAELCRTYWYPLYAFVRRKGHSPHDAQDLTQAFFAELLEKGSFGNACRKKGRFRSWLLGGLNHFLINEWERGQTWKRGGRVNLVSLDDGNAESRYLLEPASDLTPEKLYERRWVQVLLDQVLDRLREEFTADGKEYLFDHLRVFLTDVKGTVSCAAVGAKLDLSEDAVKQAVRRLRLRYRELLRQEITRTVSTSAEVDDEIRHLFELFGR